MPPVIRVTASDLVSAIAELPRDREYRYVNPSNPSRIRIDSIERPEGPVWIRRYNPEKGQGPSTARRSSLSIPMLWRVANAIGEGKPFNIDRVLAASYSTRSVLEALLAYSPQFHVCHPKRIEMTESTQTIKEGHKHLLWLPDRPHTVGVVSTLETEIVIAEHTVETVYEAIGLPDGIREGMGIEIARRHAQIQVALIQIANNLGCKSYVARNDQGILYDNRPLGTLDGVITDLGRQEIFAGFPQAVTAGAYIDCVWFRNSRHMPAVMEIEHSTGVTSGLARMQSFKDQMPALTTRYVVVAPDEDRAAVIDKGGEPQFRSLRPHYFPYSAVEELHWITTRRRARVCGEDFLDSFLEPIPSR